MVLKFIRQRQTYTGAKRWIVRTIVYAYMIESLLKILSSLSVGEESPLLELRILSLLTSLVISIFVWKGYTLARMILATWMTCVGIWCLYVVFGLMSLDNHHMVFLIVGSLWTVFGLTLFLVNRIGTGALRRGVE